MQTDTIRLIRKPEVSRKTGLVPSEIYRLIGLGQFPQQIKLGQRASAWLESEVDAWIAERAAKHRVPIRKPSRSTQEART